jgi:hypothetical protein
MACFRRDFRPLAARRYSSRNQRRFTGAPYVSPKLFIAVSWM